MGWEAVCMLHAHLHNSCSTYKTSLLHAEEVSQGQETIYSKWHLRLRSAGTAEIFHQCDCTYCLYLAKDFTHSSYSAIQTHALDILKASFLVVLTDSYGTLSYLLSPSGYLINSHMGLTCIEYRHLFFPRKTRTGYLWFVIRTPFVKFDNIAVVTI